MFRCLFGITVSSLLLAFNVNAQVICSSSATDSDGDGWGWENDESCRVVATTTSPPLISSPSCTSASSDSDGDGWGWENNASCQVTNGITSDDPTEPTQGSQIAEFTGSLSGAAADTHYFTIAEATSVSIYGLDDYSLELLLYDSTGSLIWQDYYWDSNQCLQAGSYTAQINQYSSGTLQPQNYTIGITDTNLDCVAPSSTVNIGFGSYYAQITTNGTVLTQTNDNGSGVSAFDRFGTRLWDFDDAEYFNTAESLDDGSVLLSYSSRNNYEDKISLIDSTGAVKWTVDAPSYIYEMEINNNVAALSADAGIISLNLQDGSTRFYYEYRNYYGASNNIAVLDDGSIVLPVIDQNGAVQILTFD